MSETEEELVAKEALRASDRTLKSTVVAEFVDAIPEAKNELEKYRKSWVAQDGLNAGIQKAFNNPGRALLLVRYDIDKSKSRQKQNAKLRVAALERQGYTESMGWTVRAVENEVYIMYSPRGYE